MTDTLSEKLVAAYVRGVEWRKENPEHTDYPFRFKAARDYADAILGETALRAASNSGVVVTDAEYAWGLLLNTARSVCEKLESETASVTWLDQLALRKSVDLAALTAEPQAVEPVAWRVRLPDTINDDGDVVPGSWYVSDICLANGQPLYAKPQPDAVPDGWQPLATAPAACTLLATYFDEESAEWIVEIFVAEIPKAPFTHWQMITSPQTPSPLSNEDKP